MNEPPLRLFHMLILTQIKIDDGMHNLNQIPISIHKAIYLFPTHSPNHLDNSWIAYEHVARFDKKQKLGQPEQTRVTFKNGYTQTLDVSVHTFEAQWQRTFELMYKSGRIEL